MTARSRQHSSTLRTATRPDDDGPSGPRDEFVIDGPAGQRLGVAEYGFSQGIPAFYCHGFPACRREAALAHEAARAAGLRLIAVDRPGYGKSTPQRERQIIDWPRDVTLVADRLGLERFHVIGVSGGGPYALACTAELADRVMATTVVCGLAPLPDPRATQGMMAFERLWLALAQGLPNLTSGALVPPAAALARAFPRATVGILRQVLPPPDRRVLRRPAVFETIIDSVHEAFRQDSSGAARDLLLFARPWGFALEEIRRPVTVWHGEDDRTVPVTMGKMLAKGLPNCEGHFISGEGHFSLPVSHMSAILDSVIS